MILELLRPLSFFLSMLSLYPVMLSAFFVPGARWEERLEMALLRVALAAAVCFGSGLLYAWHSPNGAASQEPILSTLPMRLFLCAMGGMVVLFALSWWLDAYYVPMLRHDCCRP
jgi:peptidoglycan biosynthesis protein MviN/MurJ (putative lipid II flippase)